MSNHYDHIKIKVALEDFDIRYNHPHDVTAILETFILNVYRTELLKKGDKVLDLGAGKGEFSCWDSKKVGLNGRVIAIEPSPEDFETLQENIKENPCDNVSPLNVAVTNFNGELQLKFKGKTFKTMCKPLQDILKEEKVDKINFCKIDIEGGERMVIPENASIFNDIHYLSMEIHDGYQDELIPLMSQLGFGFEKITKRNYAKNALKFAFRHPIKMYELLNLLKKAGEYPGVTKILKGIDIEKSSNLMIGTFFKRNVKMDTFSKVGDEKN